MAATADSVVAPAQHQESDGSHRSEAGSRKTGPGVRWQKLQQACDKVVARAVRDWLSEDMAKGQLGEALPPNSEHIVRSAQAASAAYLAEMLEKKQAEVLKAHHAAKLTRSLDEVHYGGRGSKNATTIHATGNSSNSNSNSSTSTSNGSSDQKQAKKQRRSRSPLGSREEREVEDELQEHLTEHFRAAKYTMMQERLCDQERENREQVEMNERMRAECNALLDHLLQDTSALLAPLMASPTAAGRGGA